MERCSQGILHPKIASVFSIFNRMSSGGAVGGGHTYTYLNTVMSTLKALLVFIFWFFWLLIVNVVSIYFYLIKFVRRVSWELIKFIWRHEFAQNSVSSAGLSRYLVQNHFEGREEATTPRQQVNNYPSYIDFSNFICCL